MCAQSDFKKLFVLLVSSKPLAGCYALNNKTNILSLMSVAGVIAPRNITLNKTKGSALFPPSIKDFILLRFPFTAYCYYDDFYASLH